MSRYHRRPPPPFRRDRRHFDREPEFREFRRPPFPERRFSERRVEIVQQRPPKSELPSSEIVLLQLDRGMNRLRNREKELGLQTARLSKREKYFENIASGSSSGALTGEKRSRGSPREDDDSSTSSPPLKRRRQDAPNPNRYRRRGRGGGRGGIRGRGGDSSKPELSDSMKARGKRFMQFLSLNLVQHRRQIRDRSRRDSSSGDSKDSQKSRNEVSSPSPRGGGGRKALAEEELTSIRREKKTVTADLRQTTRNMSELAVLRNCWNDQRNDLCLAHYFRTETTPSVCFKPGKLLPEQAEKIRGQIEEEEVKLEETRNRIVELLQFEQKPSEDPKEPEDSEPESPTDQ